MPYTKVCPRCGAENAEANSPAPGERWFCSQCGARLDEAAAAAAAASESGTPVPASGGEAILGRVLREFRGVFGKSKRASVSPPPSARRQPRTSVLVEKPVAAEAPAPVTPVANPRINSVPTTPPPSHPNPLPVAPPAPQSAPPATPQSASPGASVSAFPDRIITTPAGTSGGVAPGGSIKPFTPGAIFAQRYHILTTRELSYSIYYDAIDLLCPNAACRTLQPQSTSSGLCARCSTPLNTVLIHERHGSGEANLPLDAAVGTAVLTLGRAGHPDILLHRDILAFQQAVYTVVEHPGRWGVLVRGRRTRSPEDALMVLGPIGRVLIYLHQQGLAFTPATASLLENLERLVTFGGDGAVKVADLSACAPFAHDGGRAQVARDIAFLGQTLGYLTTGTSPIAGALEAAPLKALPEEHRGVIEAALQGQYPTVAAMLAGLSMAPAPAIGRPLKPIHGQGTDPGRKHARNEDSVVTFTFDKAQQGGAVPIGFYMVADGMGGHDAGDVASRMVYQVVTEWILKSKVLPDLRKETRKLTTENIPGNLLKEAVQAANKVLARHASAQQSNMGSTVTAALVIGNIATIANVGDSRTYLLREGQLRQITQDHSLVARLVQAHVITQEQVRSHPQRNQIFRSLGQQENVEVDTFTVLLSRGDRLILCSDGLWEMVLDAEIQHLVETARSPQQACDALVAAANAAGGEDNISAIVVEME